MAVNEHNMYPIHFFDKMWIETWDESGVRIGQTKIYLISKTVNEKDIYVIVKVHFKFKTEFNL